jgi:hypothetical protein
VFEALDGGAFFDPPDLPESDTDDWARQQIRCAQACSEIHETVTTTMAGGIPIPPMSCGKFAKGRPFIHQ